MQYLTDWKLSCFYPYVPYFENSFEVGIRQKSLLPQISAKVPGSVQKALTDAGMLADPYYEMNSLNAEWVENKWWVYSTVFQAHKGKKYDLVFESIDYKAKVFLNGKPCGESENMFVPLVIKAEEYLREADNQLIVVLEGAPQEIGQLGYAEQTHTQKSRFTYKWDFCTRLVHLGLPGNVYLRERKPAEFKKLLFNGKRNGEFFVEFFANTEEESNIPVEITIRDASDKIVYKYSEVKKFANGEKLRFEGKAEGVKPWYPQGYGEQNLYKLTVSAGEFSQSRYVGFKDVIAEKHDANSKCPYPYLLKVNGCKIYIKGVNMTPLDMLYGDIRDERYEQILSLVKEANVNLIRVWGGGRIENEKFYELTDRYGILVWQEFPQSGAGINSLPPTTPEYLSKLEATAREAVYKANHVSLIAFSGGNELSDGIVPVDFSNKNIAMLKSVVDEICPWVVMYPTSSAGGWLNCDLEHKGNLFDVHGPWKYLGEYHYKLFNESDSVLHSEFGCDGMANMPVIERYFAPENRKVSNMAENYTWRHHGEWWDTYFRDTEIFDIPKNIEEQIAISQFMQAEGIRYAVNANRRRAYRNCGSIIWQANEPYPNISCTSLIDYFNAPKFAYYAIKKSFGRVYAGLKYDKFVLSPGETTEAEWFVTADGEERIYDCKCEIFADGNLIKEFRKQLKVGCGLTEKAGDLNIAVPECDALTVKMTTICNGEIFENMIYFPIKNGEKAKIAPVIAYMNDFKNLKNGK